MSYPENEQYRAWSGDDETRRIDATGAYDQQPSQRYAEPEPVPREEARRQKAPRERHTATLGEMFRLTPLLVEMLIIAIVGGVLYGMICWVFDLLMVRFSDAVQGHYMAMDGTFEYTMRGIAFGFFVLVGAAVLVALAAAVNRPAQIFGWLFIAVFLWAAIVLLTNPLWQSVPEVLLLLIGAGIIWGVLPVRVGSYRTNVPRLF